MSGEWVNVPSGTGLPGYSWTIAIKRLCVCVVDYKYTVVKQYTITQNVLKLQFTGK